MPPTESIPVPIDLKPPQEWLDNFPLSRKEVKALNTSFKWALQLPTTLEDLQRELSFDRSALETFRGDLDPLVRFYAKFLTYAEDYRDNIFPSIVSLPRDLKVYSATVESYYSIVYSTLRDLRDKDTGHDWSRNLVKHVIQKLTTHMDGISHVAQTVVEKLSALKDKIDVDRLAVLEHFDHLKKKIDSGAKKRSSQGKSLKPSSKHQNDGTIFEVILLQYDLFGDSLYDVLRNATATITIVNSMRVQFIRIRDDFNTILENTQAKDVESIPANLLGSDSPKAVYRLWNELSAIISELPT